MDIKPIETVYKGYRFRSRLEARWAVFFDALNLSWEYEVEGFELESGRYLPDFKFTQTSGEINGFTSYVEIKSSYPSKYDLDRIKELANRLIIPIPVMIGDPYSNYCFDSDITKRQSFIVGVEGETYDLDIFTLYVLLGLITFDEAVAMEESKEDSKTIFKMVLPILKCSKAAQKSRRARFEFGERG